MSEQRPPAPARDPGGVSMVPARRPGLAEQAYELLHEQLLLQQLVPQQRLDVETLAQALSLPNEPVREALARLAAERLVVNEPFRGYLAGSLPGADHLAQVFDVRTLLERYAALLDAEQWTARHQTRLRDLHGRMFRLHAAAAAPANVSAFRDFAHLNQQFHLLLVERAGNAVLLEVCRSQGHPLYLTLLAYGMGVRDAGAVCAEHGQIVAACERDDPAAVEGAVVAHLAARRERVLRAARARTHHGPDGDHRPA